VAGLGANGGDPHKVSTFEIRKKMRQHRKQQMQVSSRLVRLHAHDHHDLLRGQGL
jgi:hypothetical protein